MRPSAIGLAVRAPAAGRVVRLRASPYGYGRAVYIDLDDAARGVHGQQVVFGHLSDFAPRWRALVVAEQKRLGKAFSLRRFHDTLFENGSVPISFHRRFLESASAPGGARSASGQASRAASPR